MLSSAVAATLTRGATMSRTALLLGGGGHPRRQRGADAGPAEADLKPLHPELGDRDEVGQVAAGPAELLLVERHLELAPRERVRPGAHLHHGPVGRGESERDAPVVEIGHHAKARIERIQRALTLARKEGDPSVHRRREVVRPIAALLGMKERQLRRRRVDMRSRAPGKNVAPDGAERSSRIVVEPLGETVEEQDIPGGSTELAGAQNVADQLTLDALGIDPHRPYRRGARPHDERKRRCQQGEQRAPARHGSDASHTRGAGHPYAIAHRALRFLSFP